MNKLFLAMVMWVGMSLTASAATYDINLMDFGQTGATLTGTMTFADIGDGAGPSEFDLILTFTPSFDPLYSPIALDSSTVGYADYSGGSGLVAGPTALTFDMSSGAFLQVAADIGLSGSTIGFCIGCSGGASIIEEGGIISTQTLTGVVTLGTVTAVPLPAGGVLALTGLAVFAGFRRHKRVS